MPQTPKNNLQNPAWALSGIGVEFFGAIAGMGLVGWAIDKFLVGSGHTALLTCLVIGIIGGGYNFIRQALSLNRKALADYRKKAAAREASSGSAPPPLPPISKSGGSTPQQPGHGWFQSESAPDDDESSPSEPRP